MSKTPLYTNQITFDALLLKINVALFERNSTQNPKLLAALREMHPKATQLFKDNYTLEFLGIPDSHNENELQELVEQHPLTNKQD